MFGKFFDKLKGDSSEEKNSLPIRAYYEIESFDHAIEYNNVVMNIVHQNHDNMEQMNFARDLSDHRLAEEARLVWLKDLDRYQSQLKTVGAYGNNDILYQAALEYIFELRELLKEGYKERIELLKAGREGTSEEIALKDENNAKMRELARDLNDGSDEFLEDFDEYGESKTLDAVDFEEMQQFVNPQENLNDPLFEPIHGVSLRDYAAAASHLANGMAEDLIIKALGIEKPIWDEANQLWVKRMQVDPEFKIASLYGKYFSESDQHPILGALQNKTQASAGSSEDHLSRIMNDEKYYYELAGARMAAYDAGLDGAQWILDNYAISLGDFQSAAMKWMQKFDNVGIMMKYQDRMQVEYAKKFTESQGGNVADDIEF